MEITTPHGRIVISEITPWQSNVDALSHHEITALERFTSDKRRNEWSTWRRLANQALAGSGKSIYYNSLGAPTLTLEQVGGIERGEHEPALKEKQNGVRESVAQADKNAGQLNYIGISHSRQRVAVMLSSRRCAIDIESLDRDFSRAIDRFMSSEERELEEGYEHFNALVWCAKECIYKLIGRSGIDMQREIVIKSVDHSKQQIDICVVPQGIATQAESATQQCITAHFTTEGGEMICYAEADNTIE